MVLQWIAKLLKRTPERYQKQAKHLIKKNDYRQAKKKLIQKVPHAQKLFLS